ncbi:Lrp/AsnC family transcriptional regulator [Haloferax larsenii]|uniref:Lrp/AsnC family transcriptional regulator n=1 Tax=Haloferax larsenii TaxID=302484 RepID=A0ABY5RAT3_HALLR|nr:Lrp/AsnC family transcriptional regulator [Haloferax larsenii]ELZ84352.1 Asn family transcriptional regulator [Haloferax larsenii JCM 13917]UVE49254.1 Lrp/AsnC family transcriptional regulator [Haloferax larsenii]
MATISVDDLDKYILYALQKDARHTSGSDIAEAFGVSASTVRNRVGKLESKGVIRGSHLDIDYEALGYQLHTIIFCTAPIPEREQLAKAALEVDGVISVREIMTGEKNVHITALGRNSDDLSRIGRELSALGFEIAEEELIRNEYTSPYSPFGKGSTDEDDD